MKSARVLALVLFGLLVACQIEATDIINPPNDWPVKCELVITGTSENNPTLEVTDENGMNVEHLVTDSTWLPPTEERDGIFTISVRFCNVQKGEVIYIFVGGEMRKLTLTEDCGDCECAKFAKQITHTQEPPLAKD